MAFIYEDGTGVANANSLCNVAFADNYHAERGNVAWAALDTPTKQQLLIKATDYFVGTYYASLAGYPVSATQALPYPRYVNSAASGNPVGIQQGIAELALIAKSTPLSPSVTRGKKRVKVGSLEVEYDGNAPTATRFVSASLRFGPFLSGSANGHTGRLIRC